MEIFSQICQQISATTKKLEKEKILSEYLKSLNDEDLALACIFLSGAPFALRDQRTTNVGFAAVRDALNTLEPQAEDRLGPILLRTGDLGTAVEELFQNRAVSPTLSLKDLRSFFDQLVDAGTNQQKRQAIVAILSGATPLEAKYLLKILLGGMRIGLQESLVESSIAKAFGRKLN